MADSELAVRIIFGIIAFVGAVINCFIFHLLMKVKLGSRSTMTLLCNQCLFDALSCLIAILTNVTGPVVHTANLTFNAIMCYLWSYGSFLSISVVLSMHNLICISVDRLFATFCPIGYKQRQKWLIVCSYIYLLLIVLVLCVPFFFNRRYQNELCLWEYATDDPNLPIVSSIHSYIWLVFEYVLPALLTGGLHALIVWKLLRNRKQACVSPQSDDQTEVQMRRLVGTTVLYCLVCALFQLPDALAYLFERMQIGSYDPGSVMHQARLMSITIAYCVNPCILILLNRPLRELATQQFVMCATCPHLKWQKAAGKRAET
ncbi:hypothetical protein EG68_05524 [Paragonimus skrjabini miyazakii]|uniref:G-protein coupled receptors family 1 profile domain-containing protein n=1 Tax=Paragonimus skrjabini miyazakii TaxID=59628 RepID=A0A8S9YA68_9TREM|nr:hypothetical protein EG68_05524 [Paragonimus skrjabini miyazakii]